MTPSLNAVNVHDVAAVAAALRSAFDKLGGRPRRVALVIPDTAAKVSLLRFEKIPAVLVGIHVFGAVCVFMCVQQLLLELRVADDSAVAAVGDETTPRDVVIAL